MPFSFQMHVITDLKIYEAARENTILWSRAFSQPVRG
jgi:hypothetical protein